MSSTTPSPSSQSVLYTYQWPASIQNRPLSGLASASLKLKHLARHPRESALALGWGNTNAVRFGCLCFVDDVLSGESWDMDN